jgi:hypothetical protein
MPAVPQPKNAQDEPVYLARLTLSGAGNDAAVVASQITDGTAYGVQGVVTRDNDMVYAWLPANTEAKDITFSTETDMYTTSDATTVGTGNAFTLASSATPTFVTGTVRLYFNGTVWNGHSRSITVRSSDGKAGTGVDNGNGTVSVKGFAGDYAIYDGGDNTGVSFILSGGSETLNYYRTADSYYSLTPADPSYTYIYTGAPQGPAINEDHSISQNAGATYTNETATNVGTYTITASAAEKPWANGTKYLAAGEFVLGTYTIEKAELTITDFTETDGQIASLDFSGLPGSETLTAGADYTVADYKVEGAALVSLTLATKGGKWLNYTLTDGFIIPAIDISDTHPKSGEPLWSYVDEVYTIKGGADVTVVGDNSMNGRRVEVEAGATATVTLQNATIVSASSPLYLNSNAILTLNLIGTNTLKSSNSSNAGLHVSEDAELTLDGAGSLSATGSRNAAGIGGGNGETGGMITIHGGTVMANGGNNAAGIGGGNGGGGTITISGGTVKATGGSNGAAIGGGRNQNTTGTVTITGGSIRTSGNAGPPPTNGIVGVYLNTLTVDNPAAATLPVTGSINGVDCDVIPNPGSGVYGIRDVTTDADSKVYFWLPPTGSGGTDAERIALTVGGLEYAKTFARNAGSTATTLLLSVRLEVTAPTFATETYGYAQPDAQSITIVNRGGDAATITDVTVSDADLFTVGGSGTTVAPDGDIATWTIQPKAGLDAGTYAATVTVTYNGTASPTATATLNFTVGKKTPAADDLAFDLGDIVWSTNHNGIGEVTVKDSLDGLGAVTVKYDGSSRLPGEPGTYTVTVDIAGGANYTGVTGLALGTFTIVEPVMPVLPREIVLPQIPGVTTLPSAGLYRVSSRSYFEFTLQPSDAVAGLVPSVTTGRADDGEGGVIITPQADGSYLVRIADVRQNLAIVIEYVPAAADLPAAQYSRVWAAGAKLYLAAGSRDVRAKVYTLTGTPVKTLRVAAGETVAETLPAGVYIVAPDDGSQRVKVFIGRF